MSYLVQFRGYTNPPEFETIREAQWHLRDCINDDINSNNRYNKLTKVKHSNNHYEVKIGDKQGFHTYSEGWVVKV